MRRSIPLLIVVLAVQLGLAALLAVRRNPLASIPPQSPLIGAAARSADLLLVEGGTGADAGRVQIAKRNGQWILPDYFNAPADKFKVEDLLSELADLERGLPIATSASSLERFHLAQDDFERRLTLRQGTHTLGTVYFGSGDGARRSDARTAGEHAVYSVELATYELPTKMSAWFANDLLEKDPTQLAGIDVSSGHSTLHLVHQASPTPGWSTPDLPAGRHLDGTKAEALARAVGDIRLQGVLGTSPQPAWQLDHPLLTLTLHDPHASRSWVLSQARGANDYVLKASTQPWYFSLDASTGRQLLQAADPATLIVDPAAAARAAAAAAAAARAAQLRAQPRTMIIHHLPRTRKAGAADAAPNVAH